jgi:hypothetical protein
VRARLLIGAIGLAAAAYGAWHLLAQGIPDALTAAEWLAAGVVLHDFALVPATLGVCWLGAQLLPAGRRTPVAAALLVLGSLTVLAIPVLGGWGANTDNPTILDRSYGRGWLVVAAVTVLVVLMVVLLAEVSRRGRAGAARDRAPRDEAPHE